MRSFPRAARRRVAAATAATALAATGLSAPSTTPAAASTALASTAPASTALASTAGVAAASGDDLEGRRKKVEGRIDHAHDELQHSSRRARRATVSLRSAQARLDRARGHLRAVEGRLTAARARDQVMQERLAAAIERLEEAQAAVDAAGQRLEHQRAHVSDVVSETYQEGDPRLYAFASFLDARDPAELTRRVEARRAIVGEETRAYDALRAAEVLLVVQQDEVEVYRDQVSRRRAAAAAHLEQMEALRARAAGARRAVLRLVEQRSAAQTRADAARRADQRLLQQLQAERQRISALLRKRAAAARSAARTAARSAAPPATPPAAPPAGRPAAGGGPVGSATGYLSSPVDGWVTSSYGYRTHPIYGYYGLHDGTDFGAGCGAPLRAGASGTVISSYYQSVYGNRLIIDHGAVRGVGLASIYNHATSYIVGVGQRVQRGQVIGYVGSTGWSTGCHLHYMVMVNGGTVDPMGWL